jgi:putative transposase
MNKGFFTFKKASAVIRTFIRFEGLKIAQRKLSRKKKGSNRYKKQRIKVAKIHSKIVSCRKDFLHKLTTDLVTKYDVLCIEDLNVKGMMKNRKLSKAVADIGMYELRRQLEYKSNWYGKNVQVIDRWFPSSKMCSSCGQIHDMPLSKRIMDCDCGNTLDRDENAAKNILSLGMEKFKTYVEFDNILVPSTRQTKKRSSKTKVDDAYGTHHTA